MQGCYLLTFPLKLNLLRIQALLTGLQGYPPFGLHCHTRNTPGHCQIEAKKQIIYSLENSSPVPRPLFQPPSRVWITIRGTESGSDQAAPLKAMARLMALLSGSRSLTSEPVKMEGSAATNSSAVVESVGRFANCLLARFTRSSCSTAPAPATTWQETTASVDMLKIVESFA